MRGELITGQQLYHSPQSVLTNYLTWSVKPSFSCEISNSLWFWQIPNYLEPCAAAGNLCFVAIPGRKAQSKGGGIPQTGIKPSKPQRFIPKAALESLGGFSFSQNLFSHHSGKFHRVLSHSRNGSALGKDCHEEGAGFCRHQALGSSTLLKMSQNYPNGFGWVCFTSGGIT